MFGDYVQESKLINEMYNEIQENQQQTVILYPTQNAQLLSEWMDTRPDKNLPIRIVALDGTYSQASRQYKYLSKCLSLRSQHQNISIPVVKLDLEEGKCISAYAGIQHQPNMEKICTFQAVVLAFRQTGVNSQICENLFSDLNNWIKSMLELKIKLGKKSVKRVEGFAKGEFQPADFVVDFINNRGVQLLQNHLCDNSNTQENDIFLNKHKYRRVSRKIETTCKRNGIIIRKTCRFTVFVLN